MNPAALSSTYEIRAEIGSGGGGVVYKAWHKRLEMEVVLKELKAGTAASLATQRAEVDILKTIKHSYLPQVYDFVVDGNKVYTVMEYIQGQSLDALLKNGEPFPQQMVIKWARQLCEALAYLHGQKPPILHGDIKPANVMLTEQGDICLIDFNISLLLGDDGAVAVGRSRGYASPEHYGPEDFIEKLESALVSAGHTEATEHVDNEKETEYVDRNIGPLRQNNNAREFEEHRMKAPSPNGATEFLRSYESPKHSGRPVKPNGTAYLRQHEETEDNPFGGRINSGTHSTSPVTRKLDVRSDIYSLGATLYHLLTGERPALAAADVKPLPSFGLSLSEGIIYIVEKAMSPNPANRFQTAEQMLKAVAEIHKLDQRWKKQVLKKDIAAIVLIVLFGTAMLSTFTGYRLIGREKVDCYNALVYQVENAQGEQLEVLFSEAVGLFPQSIEAFHAKAAALAAAGEFAECHDFITESLAAMRIDESDVHSMAKLGDMYFILGTCYFEDNDYSNAINFYRSAVEANQINPEYYRDYGIALARIDDIPAAEQMLARAEELHLSDDSLALLHGEIAYAKVDYDEAISQFQNTLRIATDEYISYRAYRIMDDAYKRQGSFDKAISLLQEAKSALSLNRQIEITERLANAYIKAAESGFGDSNRYYQGAIESIEEILDKGYNMFHLRQNLAILYQQIEDYTKAEGVLLVLQRDFPNDYRVPMRMAYLCADIQARIANEARDYTDTKLYFDDAWSLYQSSLKPGESDPEMLMLEEMMEQLRQGGWIS